MPTAYTLPVEDGTVTEFNEFVWRCARAMGACVTMKEESLDVPPPDRFEPNGYHLREQAAAEARLVDLEALTVAELRAVQVAEVDGRAKVREECVARNAVHAERYAAMIAKVEVWEPPSADHAGLKEFMLEQLQMCMPDFEDSDRHWPDQPRLSLEVYRQRRIADVRRDITFHAESYAKEVERTASRNEWLCALRASVPQP